MLNIGGTFPIIGGGTFAAMFKGGTPGGIGGIDIGELSGGALRGIPNTPYEVPGGIGGNGMLPTGGGETGVEGNPPDTFKGGGAGIPELMPGVF